MNIATASDHLSRDLSLPQVPYDAMERTMMMRGHDAAGRAPVPPEHRLMVALVMDAMRCIEKYAMARDTRGKRLFAEEVRWILSDDMERLYSFARICEALDLDRHAVRRSLGLLPGRGEDRPSSGAADACFFID